MEEHGMELANEELKRADHLIYVSLKYTRTVDVIKNIIERLLNAQGYLVDATVHWALSEKLISGSIPTSPVMKSEFLKKHLSSFPEIISFLDFYLFLRKVSRAEYTSHREYRRHVTMSAIVEGKQVDITIDVMHEYYEKIKIYVDFLKKTMMKEE